MALNPANRELGLQRWKNQRALVLKRDEYICHYCGGQATQVDHVISRKQGGGHELENLVACCASCNSRKGAKSEGLFLLKDPHPPVLSGNLYPKTTSTVQAGPMSGQPKPKL
jgi:5-methylcytosine-specific restriction endonuclease McrA